MKYILTALILLCAIGAFSQSAHLLKYHSRSGKVILISFKERFAQIEVAHDSLVFEAFGELKLFMSYIKQSHFTSRLYPLYVISPENKYYTYPLNRQKLIKSALAKL